MAIAAPQPRSRNTGRKMHPTIPQFKSSLPPFPLSFWSFSLVLSLWCATLACATLLGQIEQCKLECQTTTIAGVSIQGNCETKCPPGVIPPSQEDHFKHHLDDKFEPTGTKRKGDQEIHPNEPDSKRQKLQGELRELKQCFDPASTEREWKNGETEASGDISVSVGLEITGDGEFALKIRRMTPGSTHDEVERAEQMAQNAAMLLLHAEMLQDMGQKLLAQSQASFRSILGMPSPPIRNSDS